MMIKNLRNLVIASFAPPLAAIRKRKDVVRHSREGG